MSDSGLTPIGPRMGGRGLVSLALILALGIGLIAGLAIVARPGTPRAPVAPLAVVLDVPVTGAAIPGAGQLVVSGRVSRPVGLLRLTLRARGSVLGSGAVRPGSDGTFTGPLTFRPPLTAAHGEMVVAAAGASSAPLARTAVRLLPPAAVYVLSPVPNQQLAMDSAVVEGLARADLDQVVLDLRLADGPSLASVVVPLAPEDAPGPDGYVPFRATLPLPARRISLLTLVVRPVPRQEPAAEGAPAGGAVVVPIVATTGLPTPPY